MDTLGGIEYEADDKHRVELMKLNGLAEDSNSVGGVAVRPREEDLEEDAVELMGEECKRFRTMAALLNYLGQDRSDIQYATKEICARMSRPTVGGLKRIKRAVRYLVRAKKVVWKMREWGDDEKIGIEVKVDSD